MDNSGLWRQLHLCQRAKRNIRFFCFSGVDYHFNFRNWLICIAAFRCLARSEAAGYVLVSVNKTRSNVTNLHIFYFFLSVLKGWGGIHHDSSILCSLMADELFTFLHWKKS